MDAPGLFFVPEPFFLVGPTAVGKTEIAVEAAALCGAEIISADAFQVYSGLARLTAKPSDDDLARVRHHLIGHVPQTETYNVARYHAEACVCLRIAEDENRPLIVVGGSGLYVKSLTHGLSLLPPAQPEIRAELDGTALRELVARLRTLDPVAADNIDTLNKRRVVRAVEVCIVTGARFSDQQTAWRRVRPPIRGVFLVRDKEDLADRINRRAAGLLGIDALAEAELALRTPFSETAARIIGLREIGAFLTGKITGAGCREQIQNATRRYAKRQMTWFRGESFEETINLSTATDARTLASVIADRINGARASQSSFGDKAFET